MTTSADPTGDPAVTGVPPETPEAVRPSATGLVTGPIDGDTNVAVADVAPRGTDQSDDKTVVKILRDDQGGRGGTPRDPPPNITQ
ncbi:MAG: hypothetical protein ABW328_00665, partial [Ilumatobacteraceae bacterium]